MNYENLFSEGRIGSLVLKNRVIMPAMGTFLASAEGEVTDHQIAYFEERAKGGVGLIITEVTAVDYTLGKVGPCHPRVDDPKFIPMLCRLADAVHKYDTKIFMQLNHAGRQTDSTLTGGRQPVAPSPVPCSLIGGTPRELTTEEIRELVGKYITGAVICKAARIDGVELHGAHGYLINQFMSPKTNKRTDEYGGSFEGRMRFAGEILEGIKEQCGRDYPVIIRLSIDEFIDGGIEAEEGVRIAKFMEKIGVDAINVSCGIFDSIDTFIEPITYPQGWRTYLSEAVKKEVKIPVIAVGVIRDPDFAEKVICDQKADFVAIGRGLIADPEWCNKALKGRAPEIRKCISCLYCLDREVAGGPIGCAVNARAGREIEYREFNRNGNKRKVVVIGGGPGGMEAARILALRNFDAVLFEKEECLGGQLNFGNRPRGKDKLNWLVEYLRGQLEKLEVEVKHGMAVDAETIQAENPYAVFIATGSYPIIPKIEGIEKDNVCRVQEALVNSDAFKVQRIAVVGGGMTGCETADLFASGNNEVHLVEMLPDIATGAGFVDKLDMAKRLKKAGIHLHTCHQLVKIKEDAIRVRNMEENREFDIKVDKVVISLGVKSNTSLYDSIKGLFDHVYLLGDAKKPGKIGDAIKDGFEKAMLLDNF